MQKSKVQFKIKNYLKSFKFLAVIFSFLFLVFGLMLAKSVTAAELKLMSDNISPLGVGQEFQVDLMLDTQDKEINAVAVTLSFPENLVEIVEIRDGSSVLTLWVERPRVEQQEIRFAGIVPGGFAGIVGPFEKARPGKVLGIVLKSKNPGQGEVIIEEAELLLHDGLGTRAEFQVSDFKFQVLEDVEVMPVESVPDNISPESFTPEVVHYPELFEGKYFLVFSTTDKDSGISHYEVQETRDKIQETKWQRAESPYVLKDQNLRSYIYVKVVDRAGNERIEKVDPLYPIMKWYQVWWIWIIIVVIGLVIIYVIKRFLYKEIRLKIKDRR